MTTPLPILAARTTRVTFDPNSYSRRDPRYHVALFGDADSALFENEIVLLVIPADEDDEGATIGVGRVAQVDEQHELCYIQAFSDSFRVQPPRTLESMLLTRESNLSTAVVRSSIQSAA